MMRTTAERLRWWIVGAGLLLVVAITIYTVAGRLKQRLLRHDLPARLGINIQQDSNGFTLSKSEQGRTLFTLHAGRALQYKRGGEAKLHDVSIVFYGRGPRPREDRIRGQSFSYDQTTGIVKADGAVEIDLQPPASTAQSPEDAAKDIIHLRTSGLVFEQKTGRAYTTQLTEFRLPQAEGTAMGADYDSRDGVLQLLSQVRLHTTMQGQPATVYATHATLRRNDAEEDGPGGTALSSGGGKLGQAELENASLHSSTRDLQTAHVLVWMHSDGSVDHADFTGQTILTTVDGSRIEAPRAQAAMNAAGRVERVHAEGGVKFSQTPAPSEQDSNPSPAKRNVSAKRNAPGDVMEEGEAEQFWLTEDARSQPTHLRLLGAVQITQHPLTQPVPWTRQLNAGEVNVAFVAGQAHLVSATQSPALREITLPALSRGKQRGTVNKVLRGDRLDTTLRDGHRPETLVGTGNTELVQSDAGETDTSRGANLEVKFDEAGVNKGGAKQKKANMNAANASAKAGVTGAGESRPADSAGDIGQIRSAVQRGHVTLVRTAAIEKVAAGNSSAQEVSRGWADRADYEQADETITLTGSPRLEDSGSANGTLSLTAKQVTLYRSTGDALAAGAVQATQRQHPESQPTHIVSAQAKISHAQHTALFTGAARLWEGENAIEAPVILLTQSPQGLEATSSPSQRVRAAFVSRGQGKDAAGQAVDVEADKLIYSDADRRARFSSQVVLTEGDAVIRAERADVYLRPVAQSAAGRVTVANTPASKSVAVLPGDLSGQVDRVVANGLVSLEQPGRRGTCEELVYTTVDGRFVLTGSALRPPRVEDSQKGTVTGDTLIFLSRDDRVEVQSGGGNGASGRTLTTTHVAK
jgi:lipopolysaccharide export system protein LptA